MTRSGLVVLGFAGWLGLTLGVACSSSKSEPPGDGNQAGKAESGGGSASGGSNSPGTGGTKTETGGNSGSGGTKTETGGNSGSGGTTAQGGNNGEKKDLGGFTVELRPETVSGTDKTPAVTYVQGKVYGDVYPSPLTWNLVMEEGGCKVLNKTANTCSPECDVSSACGPEHSCILYPKAQDLGTVTMKGLGQDFNLTNVKGGYQIGGGITLAYPPCDEGEKFSVQTSGKGDYEAFSIEAVAIAPLELTSTSLVLKDGESFPVTWAPPKDSSASHILMKLDISHHGGGTAKIECDVPDTGSMTISAPMVTKLISYGIAGFPSLVVVRESIEQKSIAQGTVVLRMTSSLEEIISIPGVTSCNKDADCTAPQTCGPDLKCADQ